VRVLVTGSSGQLGCEVARQLAGGHEVVGLDLVPGPRTTEVGSVTDHALVRRLVAGVDGVVHCAALQAPHVGAASEAEFRAVNVDATAVLLEAAAARGQARFVYTSTTSVYGAAMVGAGRAVWVDETLAPVPRDIHDHSKLAAEALCRDFAQRGLPAICLRVSRLFPEAAEKVAAYRLYRGVDVRDAAAAHVLALADRSIDFDVFNISARSPFRPDELVALAHDAPAVIARHHPEATAAFAARGWRLPQTIDRVHVIDHAERRLGYAPRHGLAALLGPARWLYHLLTAADDHGDPYTPASLALEGFVHLSYQPAVADSARLYFAGRGDTRVLQLDPRRLGVAVEDAATPRGPMPHAFGPLRRDAVVATLSLEAMAQAPDALL
jgi:UDP-glucose 4-epimerase